MAKTGRQGRYRNKIVSGPGGIKCYCCSPFAAGKMSKRKVMDSRYRRHKDKVSMRNWDKEI